METKIHKMIQANLAPEIQIKESEKLNYHMEFTRIKLPLGDQARYPVHVKWVKVLRDVDYLRFFGPDVPEDQKIRYMHAMNADEARLVHDPMAKGLKEEKLAKRKATNEGAKRMAQAELIARENLRPASIGDIKRIQAEK